jgi:hypothetical protein
MLQQDPCWIVFKSSTVGCLAVIGLRPALVAFAALVLSFHSPLTCPNGGGKAIEQRDASGGSIYLLSAVLS